MNTFRCVRCTGALMARLRLPLLGFSSTVACRHIVATGVCYRRNISPSRSKKKVPFVSLSLRTIRMSLIVSIVLFNLLTTKSAIYRWSVRTHNGCTKQKKPEFWSQHLPQTPSHAQHKSSRFKAALYHSYLSFKIWLCLPLEIQKRFIKNKQTKTHIWIEAFFPVVRYKLLWPSLTSVNDFSYFENSSHMC